MKSALMTGIFYETNLLSHLDRIQEIGYETLEVWCYEPHFFYQSDDYVGTVKEDLFQRNIKVHSLHVSFHGLMDLSGADSCDRVHALETVKKQAQITSYLGGKIIVVHPGYINVPAGERSNRIGYFLEAIEKLLPLCRQLGLQVAVENMGPGYLGDEFDEIHAILMNFNEVEVGLCLDTSHAHLTGDLFRYLECLGNRIITFHLSDNNGINDDHLPPGAGRIDWRKFIEKVREINYRGPLMLEILDRESGDFYKSIQRAKENLDMYLGRESYSYC